MITKSKLINSFEELPENLSVDEVIDHIIFVEKVQKGMNDSESGKTNSKEETKRKLSKWLK